MTRYQERRPTRRAWLVLLGLCAAAWLVMALQPDGLVGGTIIVVMIGGIAALTMWSTGRYGNITLTDTHLRVGRARVALVDLHPWGVAQPGERVNGQIIGGAFGSTIGSQLVGLTRRDGRTFLVEARHPDALRAALDEALTPFRADLAP